MNQKSTEAARDEPARNTPAPSREASAQAVVGRREIGGPSGLEPTRYGDWERMGRCHDF